MTNGSLIQRPRWAGVASFLSMVAFISVSMLAPAGSPGVFLVIALLVMLIGTCLLSKYVTGRPTGILINDRNVMSMSRFQTVVWTVIVLSTFAFVALQRLMDNSAEDPLAIGIDWQLWALLGISTASLIGSPLILADKTKQQPNSKEVGKVARDFSENEKTVESNREGILYGNEKFEDARFTDLFQGDELGNTSHIDISKVQMFLFTIVTALTYLFAVVRLVDDLEPALLQTLPTPSDGLVAILGISHAGYLGSKAIDHTELK